MIWVKMFLTFFKIGLFSFGGGYAMIPIIQSEIAANGWMTSEEFANIIAIAEMTPGPIAVNSATFVGFKVLGPLGGLVATLGVALPSLIIVMLVANIFFKHKEHPLNEAIFYGIRPVIVALVLTAAYFVAETSILNSDIEIVSLSEFFGKITSIIDFKGVIIFVLSIIAIKKYKFHPIVTIVSSGVLGVLFFYIFI